MSYHSADLVNDISLKAQLLRIQVLKMVYAAKSGHIGGAFSVAEIITSLFMHHLKVDPARPDWDERDRLLFSKGHACAMLYAAMAERGFLPKEELMTFRQLGSRLQGHPDPARLKGIEICSGPLGHGIAVGCGMALALAMNGDKPSSRSAPSAYASRGCVYVVIGDGETDAGIVWEGAMTASKYRLGNLKVILDLNGVQQTGATSDVMPLEPIAQKWLSFGWHVQEIDGHNVSQVLSALDLADQVHARPSIIIARTTKGKGVSFMEYDHRWHGRPPNRAEYEIALKELEEGVGRWRH